MGAELQAREQRFPPLQVDGSRLRAITYELDVASAQVKSCVLLAALAADGSTTVIEPTPQPRPHRADAAAPPRRRSPASGSHA